MDFLFELERAVEVIEQRVPMGRLLMKGMLTLAVAVSYVELSHVLLKDLLRPSFHLVEGLLFHLPQPSFPNIASVIVPWIVVAILFIGFLSAVRRFNSRIYSEFTKLKESLGRFESIFWRRLSQLDKEKLVRELSALGPHTASIFASGITDCAVLARDVYGCLLAAKWQVNPIRWETHTSSWENGGGFFIWFKPSASDFNRKALSALVIAANGPVGGLGFNPDQWPAEARPPLSEIPDMQIVLGPKRIANA